MASTFDKHHTHVAPEAYCPAFIISKPSNGGVVNHVNEVESSPSLAPSVEILSELTEISPVREARALTLS